MRNPFQSTFDEGLDADPGVLWFFVHPKQVQRVHPGKVMAVKLELETVILAAELDEEVEDGMMEEEVDHPGLVIGDVSGRVRVLVKADDGTLTMPTEQRSGEKPQGFLPGLHQLEERDHRPHVIGNDLLVRFYQFHAEKTSRRKMKETRRRRRERRRR